VISKASRKLLDPEEEKKRAERRRRERRHRERDAKDGKSKKPDRKLDIIDKLDVTSIYGTGCEYFQFNFNDSADIKQYSITTDHLMLATHIETSMTVAERQCKLSPRIH
jgi:hypothetical protein